MWVKKMNKRLHVSFACVYSYRHIVITCDPYFLIVSKKPHIISMFVDSYINKKAAFIFNRDSLLIIRIVNLINDIK